MRLNSPQPVKGSKSLDFGPKGVKTFLFEKKFWYFDTKTEFIQRK
jgi:hypothetical protein